MHLYIHQENICYILVRHVTFLLTVDTIDFFMLSLCKFSFKYNISYPLTIIYGHEIFYLSKNFYTLSKKYQLAISTVNKNVTCLTNILYNTYFLDEQINALT